VTTLLDSDDASERTENYAIATFNFKLKFPISAAVTIIESYSLLVVLQPKSHVLESLAARNLKSGKNYHTLSTSHRSKFNKAD
jgi:hypothetical protein